MISTTTRMSTLVLVFIAFLATASQGQICPPTPAGFDGLTGSPMGAVMNNSAILDFITGSNSSDAVNSDNVAEAYMGEAIAVQFSDTRVPAGSPFTIAYSLGVQPTALQVPTVVDGDIWLDINNVGNFFGLVDGLGLTRPFPDPLGTTPGPTNIVNLNLGVTVDPAALGICVTFQTLVVDALAPAPFNISFSNPILFGIAPVVRGMTPQIGATGSTVQMDIPGQAQGGEQIIFPQGQLLSTNLNQEVIVPTDALSGTVSATIFIWNSLPSDDGINDYFVVTDQVVVPTGTPGPIALTLDPNLPVSGSLRASVVSSVANATAVNTHTIQLNAGDIVDIEVFSTDLATQQILDGLGSLLNPLAQEGFDPVVTLQQGSNLDFLVWEDPASFGTTGPFNLISDDNSGPMNNARIRWQAKWTDTYNIVVNAATAAGFVGGNYLLNVVVTPAPTVTRFNVSGLPVNNSNRINIVQQGGTIDLVCVNLIPGNTYAVDFIPKAGAPFTTRTITGVLATTSSLLTVTVPAAAASDLPMGLHQIRLRDEVTMVQGLVWDNSVFTPTLGVMPDLLSIAGATVTTASTTVAAATGMMPVTSLNTESIIFRPSILSATNMSNGFISATDPGGSSVMYAEALGLAENFFLLFDSAFDTDAIANGATNNGIYNPNLRVYPLALLNIGPYNDDDGALPTNLFPTPMGIGLNAAIIDTFFPLSNPGGGPYSFLLDESIIFGPTANHACLVNIVIQ